MIIQVARLSMKSIALKRSRVDRSIRRIYIAEIPLSKFVNVIEHVTARDVDHGRKSPWSCKSNLLQCLEVSVLGKMGGRQSIFLHRDI